MIKFGENLRAYVNLLPDNSWVLERRDFKDPDKWDILAQSPYLSLILSWALSDAAKRADSNAGVEITTLQAFWESWCENAKKLFAPMQLTVDIAWEGLEKEWLALLEGAPHPKVITFEQLREIRAQLHDDADVLKLCDKVEHLLEFQSVLALTDVDDAVARRIAAAPKIEPKPVKEVDPRDTPAIYLR